MLLKKAYKSSIWSEWDTVISSFPLTFLSSFLSLLQSLLYTIEICVFQISGIFYKCVDIRIAMSAHCGRSVYMQSIPYIDFLQILNRDCISWTFPCHRILYNCLKLD